MASNNNYIHSNKKRFGENFLATKGFQGLYKEMPRLFKDFAYGNIVPSQYEDILLSPLLLQPALTRAKNEAEHAKICFEAINFWLSYGAFANDQNMLGKIKAMCTDFNIKMRVYDSIAICLEQVMMTGNLDHYILMTSQIKDYKAVFE